MVKLTWYELLHAAEVGVLRRLESITKHRTPRFLPEGRAWDVHIEGACGELALGKVLNVYTPLTVNTFKHPDVANRFQVRTRSRRDYDLLVQPQDADDEIFVLVNGCDGAYEVVGWMSGREAKQEQWLADHGGYGKPAYFVPRSSLHPMEELPHADGHGTGGA